MRGEELEESLVVDVILEKLNSPEIKHYGKYLHASTALILHHARPTSTSIYMYMHMYMLYSFKMTKYILFEVIHVHIHVHVCRSTCLISSMYSARLRVRWAAISRATLEVSPRAGAAPAGSRLAS